MFAFVSAFPKSLHCTDEAQQAETGFFLFFYFLFYFIFFSCFFSSFLQAETVLSAVLSIYIYMYRIQTDARVITGNTTEIKNRGRRPRFFISRLDFP